VPSAELVRKEALLNCGDKVFENRKKLVSVVDTVILSGQLNLPLRGHRDDSKYHPEVY
jgi:hypothetical protein